MNFEENIATYFGSTQYPQWSVMGILQYLAEYMDYTSDSKEEISKVLAKHLLHISVGINFKKSAKNKAKKLYAALDTTLSRAEIIQFFDEQDVRFYKVSHVNLQMCSKIKMLTCMLYHRNFTRSMLKRV